MKTSFAKLTHLIRIVIYVVAGVNGVPAFIPLLGPSGEGFRSAVAVAAVTIIVSVGAYFMTRATLANFESRIRFSLNPGAARQFLAFVQQETV